MIGCLLLTDSLTDQLSSGVIECDGFEFNSANRLELGIDLTTQKMEREKLEKLRRKEDKAKAEAAKRAAAAKGDKVNKSILHSRLP